MSLNGKTATTTALIIANSAPWPDIPVQPMIDQFRVPGEYGENVVKEQLITAITAANDALQTVAPEILPAMLADLEQEQIDGTGRWVRHYTQAVYCAAQSYLPWVFETLNRKEAAEVQGDRSQEISDHWDVEYRKHIDKIRQHFNPDLESSDGFHASLI